MKVKYLRSAQNDVQKIKNEKVRQNIRKAVTQLKETSSVKNLPNVKKMSGHPSAYRMRIGNYRLGFFLKNDTVELSRFAKRNNIYKLFP